VIGLPCFKSCPTIKMTNGSVKKWRKVLYEDNQGYDDNFTPTGSFLAAIEKNKGVRVYTRAECLAGASRVGNEVCCVLVFWSVHHLLLRKLLTPSSLIGAMALSLLVLGLHRRLTLGSSLVKGFSTSLLFSIIGFALSPVLSKLTDSISTDTIHSMAAAGLVLHLFTRNYGILAPLVSSSTSLNAAVFSAVCLASRFDHHLAAFALLSLAVLLFLPLPPAPPLVPPLISSLTHWLAAFSCILLTSASVAPPLVLLVTLQVVCPLMFHRLQSAKSTIHGPWDEAVLR